MCLEVIHRTALPNRDDQHIINRYSFATLLRCLSYFCMLSYRGLRASLHTSTPSSSGTPNTSFKYTRTCTALLDLHHPLNICCQLELYYCHDRAHTLHLQLRSAMLLVPRGAPSDLKALVSLGSRFTLHHLLQIYSLF